MSHQRDARLRFVGRPWLCSPKSLRNAATCRMSLCHAISRQVATFLLRCQAAMLGRQGFGQGSLRQALLCSSVMKECVRYHDTRRCVYRKRVGLQCDVSERCSVEWRCFSDAEACHTSLLCRAALSLGSAKPGFVSLGVAMFFEQPDLTATWRMSLCHAISRQVATSVMPCLAAMLGP